MRKSFRKRLSDYYASDQFQKTKRMTKEESGTGEEMDYLSERSQTIGNILCCKCGIPTPPNEANMCKKCLSLEIGINDLPSHVSILHCRDCVSYLQPPSTWVKAERESKELLSFCLRRLDKLAEFRLTDAKFVYTESSSKRIKLQLKVQREARDGVYVEKTVVIVYIVIHKICPSCMPADHDHWEALVQVRQYVPHMRTLLYLECLILKHGAASSAVKLKQACQGLDFFFAKKSDAVKFSNFICGVVPAKQQNKFHKKLMSQDLKSNIFRYTFSVTAEISPICQDDLVYLSPKLSSKFGQIGPLVICTKLKSTITLLNPFTLKDCTISADQYWRTPFEPLLSSRQLVQYVVLDVIVVSSEVNSGCRSYVLADAEVARVSDFGKNDRIISVRTHLGHILKPGDYVSGYDLCGANFNNSEVEEEHRASFPDTILIQKTFPVKWGRKSSEACSDKKTEDLAHKQLLDALGADLNSKLKIISSDDKTSHEMESIATDVAQFSELERIFADLGLSNGDPDGCITDTE